MTGDSPAPVEFQRRVTRIALAALAPAGFALAGSGAVREHGITERPTEDIDLFTSNLDVEQFRAAVEKVIETVARPATMWTSTPSAATVGSPTRT